MVGRCCGATQEFDIDAHPTRHAMQSSANSILAAALSEASRLEAAEARMLAKSQKSLTSGPDHAVTASSALRRLQPVVFPFLHRLQPHEVRARRLRFVQSPVCRPLC